MILIVTFSQGMENLCLFHCLNFLMLFPGLGQVQIKLGDFRSALSNFEKVLEVYPDNCETLKVSAKIEG